MNDDQLKRDIEEALSVRPSPQFSARVRARMAAESPRSSSTWIRWGMPGFALAAVVAAVLLVEHEENAIPRPVAIARKAPEKKPEAPPMPATQPAVSIRRAAQPSTPTVAEPEVLFDPREVAAFRKFIEGVQEERIDLAKLIELQQAASRSVPIEEIALMPLGDFAPIVIESLTIGPRRIEGGSL
jgi:hypothetical protein